jgi:hypothetical protein
VGCTTHKQRESITKSLIIIVFTNHGNFSLQEFVKGAEKSLPEAKSIPCVLSTRKKDKYAKYPTTPYEALLDRSGPFQNLVSTQFSDYHDKACLRRMVILLCQNVWDSFVKNCAGAQWESRFESKSHCEPSHAVKGCSSTKADWKSRVKISERRRALVTERYTVIAMVDWCYIDGEAKPYFQL